MEELFRAQSKQLVNQLATHCMMRLKVENKEQILLSKTIHLTRFIRLASLDHLRSAPEMENAKRVLAMISPNPNMMQPLDKANNTSILAHTLPLDGRLN